MAVAVLDRLERGLRISDVAQVVDGDWVINPNGTVSATDIGYDRLLAIGDLSWTDYEVEVPIKVKSIDPAGFEYPSGAPAIGILMRWPGHYDEDGRQPRWGFSPMGALGWYRFKEGTPGRLILSDGRARTRSSTRTSNCSSGPST